MSMQPSRFIDKVFSDFSDEPNAIAMSWVSGDAGDTNSSFTRADIWRRASRIAAGLNELVDWNPSSEKVVALVLEPGFAFISAFIACHISGVIPVPLARAKKGHALHSLRQILGSVNASAVLASEGYVDPGSVDIPVIHLPFLEMDGEVLGPSGGHEIAFIQYTSGSTGQPKGVVVTQENLLANLLLIKKEFAISVEHQFVTWLPHYHDMGLVGGLLTPIFSGIQATVMSPLSFIKKPFRWLEQISGIRDAKVISGGPNFAYQTCIDKVTDEEVARLDLSSWVTAFNGAEPIRVKTIDDFCNRFTEVGFKRKNFLTCYGLAEGTLYVAGGKDLVVMDASQSARYGASSPLVSSGVFDPKRMGIIDPDSLSNIGHGAVGEIAIFGGSVSPRYWEQPIESHDGLVRTGDLGVVEDGLLYVVGRLKEMIIINGRNYYSSDIESVVSLAVPGLIAVAAFTTGIDSQELVLICEVDRKERGVLSDSNRAEVLVSLVRRALSSSLGIRPSHVRLVGPGGVIKTTSGKNAYGRNRTAFLLLPGAVRDAVYSS